MTITRSSWARRLGLAVAIVVTFVIGWSLGGGGGSGGDMSPADAASEQTEENVIWTCSMHPQIQMPQSGQCPICGMDLIPLESDDGGATGPRTLTLSETARKLAEIETTPVVRSSAEVTLRMIGKLTPDETRVREISAWVPGRIDRLHVDYTGVSVRKGDALFDLYSPELYSAQEELVQAIAATGELEKSTLESTRRSARRTIEAARERLRLWGLTEAQIREIESRGTPSDHVTITAPMSGVVLHKMAAEGSYVKTGTPVYSIADLSVLWLLIDVYESDLAWIELSQSVEFQSDAYPGDVFTGTVTFIDPILDERTRSVKARVNVENPGGRLKPGMFARAVVRAGIEGPGGEPPLVIPASAPLVTGERAVVYVADPDEAGVYHGREIVLGPRAQDLFVVRDGLAEGERVVSNGAFKIDSALQIMAKRSMMNPEGGGAAPGHQHGDAPPPSRPEAGEAETDAPVEVIANVPDAFRRQLEVPVSIYLTTSTALSQDDLASAVAAVERLPDALHAVDPALLPDTAHEKWLDARADLVTSATAITEAGDIEAARLAFYNLSNRMIDTVRAFGASGETPIFVYHCPMAMGGDGADWLQSKVGTENPYYGSRMFTCGSRTETLVAGTDGDTGTDHSGH